MSTNLGAVHFGDDLLIFTAATRQDGRKFLQRMSWGWDPAAAGGRAGLESCNSDDRCPRQKTGRSCWGSGQQDVSAVQGTKRMLGAATRRQITN